MDARGVDNDTIKLWLDGAFIGEYSSEHSTFPVTPGAHTIRAIGEVQNMTDDNNRPIRTRPFEQKILILGADTVQTMVVTLLPPPEPK
jgi:hypothetical protein